MFTLTQTVTAHDRVIVTFLDGRIRDTSRAFASAHEFKGQRLSAPNLIGGARIWTANISPREGAADVWIQIDWPTDIEVRVSLLVDP